MNEQQRRRGAFSILTQKGVDGLFSPMSLPVATPVVIYNVAATQIRYYTFNGVFHTMVPEDLIGGLVEADPFRCEWAFYFEQACYWLTREDKSLIFLNLFRRMTQTPQTAVRDTVYECAVDYACQMRGGSPKDWADYKVPPITRKRFYYTPSDEMTMFPDDGDVFFV